MADKTIGSLTKASFLQDDSLFVMEQQGEAMSLAGEQIREFAENAGRNGAATLKKGATFTPYLRVDGDKVMLGFNNDAGLENPDEQDVRGPAGGVTTFNGRQGTVIPLAGDYTLEQITGLSEALAAVNQSLSEKASAGFGWGEQVISIGGATSYDSLVELLDAQLSTQPSNTVAAIRVDDTNGQVFATGTYWYGTLTRYATHAICELSTYAVNGWLGVKLSKQSGAWEGLEWLNPPMRLGVEYRTTERYLGKPVYTRAVWGGALPNNTYSSITCTSDDGSKVAIVGGYALTTTAASASAVTPDTFRGAIPWNDNDNSGVNAAFSLTSATLWCKIDRTSSNCIVVFKYVKR